MPRDEFSKDANPTRDNNRRKREEFEGIDRESQEDGEKMRKEGAHSNTGVGDERNPIGESESK
ncbi:hypothetical protein [Planococcus alpniumensis]|uniref:hypothetical protein n=1 Tax=Planococcus alpniumensis TaxID=2708345 RepID=UPI001B8AE00D|nr:hypothetical protein [Planococcus sp. MSAK28401]